MAQPVIYWDSSAVLSALLRDAYSDEAIARSREEGAHLLSTLVWAEVHAVLSRMRRERALADTLLEAVRESLTRGPWRRVHVSPDRRVIENLSRWTLRGADLWHLAAAKTLQADLPELKMLSFDEGLRVAARREGLEPRRWRPGDRSPATKRASATTRSSGSVFPVC